MAENPINKPKDNKPKFTFPIYIVYIALIAVIVGFNFKTLFEGTKQIKTSDFFTYFDKDEVKKLTIVKTTESYFVEVYLKEKASKIEKNKKEKILKEDLKK